MTTDNWEHRSSKMACGSCMWFVHKGDRRKLGRCRRRSPTMAGWPVMFVTDWCGDHKLDEVVVESRGEAPKNMVERDV